MTTLKSWNVSCQFAAVILVVGGRSLLRTNYERERRTAPLLLPYDATAATLRQNIFKTIFDSANCNDVMDFIISITIEDGFCKTQANASFPTHLLCVGF